MSLIKDILVTQQEEECRRNIFETIRDLRSEFPQEQERISDSFRKLCEEYNKDFFKEMK